jgi:hypothetical protein
MPKPTALLAAILCALALPAIGLDRATDPRPEAFQVAEAKIFRLGNPMPFPVSIQILGDGPNFPKVVTLNAPPAPPVPIPYPNTSMRLRVKQPNGAWSPVYTLKWKSGTIGLPGF